ncbi:hypothetical protein B0J14DRAFT_670046 [Halenospora varia]|nr:hypothetical protein B0J14DRAFT_670046 [Halenospora varia]
MIFNSKFITSRFIYIRPDHPVTAYTIQNPAQASSREQILLCRHQPVTLYYWAELQLFGGLVVFERGDSGLECKEAFVHPPSSWMLFQLSDHQINSFAALPSSTTPKNNEAFTLPFKAEKYARRVSPEDAMDLHIFRDRYERKPVECSAKGWCIRRRAEDMVGSFEALTELRKRLEEM